MKNTNNYTYAELQAMLEEAKGLAKEAVVDVIIANSSARNPMVASEIAERAGVPMGTAINWMVQGTLDPWFRRRRKTLRIEKDKTATTYVNPLNPNDTVTLNREHNIYWAE